MNSTIQINDEYLNFVKYRDIFTKRIVRVWLTADDKKSSSGKKQGFTMKYTIYVVHF